MNSNLKSELRWKYLERTLKPYVYALLGIWVMWVIAMQITINKLPMLIVMYG